VATWFDASREEQIAIVDGIEAARRAIQSRYRPDGFNFGANIGTAGGQTVPHLHVHVIPRYHGDVEDPRGGVRHVIPRLANYLKPPEKLASEIRDASATMLDATPLYGTEQQPLINGLIGDLARANRLDLAVAFVLRSGLERLIPHLSDLLDRGGELRILTGDYLDATEPNALRQLLDFKELAPDRVTIKVFETRSDLTFHPKAYLIFNDSTAAAAYVGSSNVSRTALLSGVEWNYRFSSEREAPAILALKSGFDELFSNPRAVLLTEEWIGKYESRRRSEPISSEHRVIDWAADAPPPPPKPHAIQLEALRALEISRQNGHRAGLVVLATGLGKTWLAAFDSESFPRVLFVAHREEILKQSLATFRTIRPDANLGLFTGKQKDRNANVLFASVMTLGRTTHLTTFARDHFDYIVVDEFHHASAATYRRLIDYFEPAFLLGLTATPDRTDGSDLLSLCGENLVYRCDLISGIERGLLSPFAYFGIPDLVDYSNIPWRSGRFDPEILESRVVTDARADNAFSEWTKHRGARTLAFCVSRRHAQYMSQFFSNRGARTAFVHSGPNSDPRAQTLEYLERGDLDIVFCVDMFNEGVDLPSIDTVLMLRPTESKILWLQQFGRGLRKAPDKVRLNVIDYIGNHRAFLAGASALLPGANESRAALSLALEQVANHTLQLPPGCSVEYELEALNVLRALAAPPAHLNALDAWYQAYRQEFGSRPTASQTWHAGFDPKRVRAVYGSWMEFVGHQGDLSEAESQTVREHGDFLRMLEVTQMSRSYKMVLLLSMITADCFPGSISAADLLRSFRHQVRRSKVLSQEVGPDLEDDAPLKRMLERNPIDAWIGALGTNGVRYFDYQQDRFITTSILGSPPNEALIQLTRELCQWRLDEYIARSLGDARLPPVIRCKVSHSGDRPILFLPDRNLNPGLPSGTVTVLVDGEAFEATFAKIAVNVMYKRGQDGNSLPEILRRWFGAEAGATGTNQQAIFVLKEDGYHLEPAPESSTHALLWREFKREDIPPLFGLRFSEAIWNQGFIKTDHHFFLLVSLDKETLHSSFQYQDRFISDDVFQWQSQNRTTRASQVGQRLKNHAALNIPVHLFIRKARKLPRGTAAPFTYCGEVHFADWHGDSPITVEWGLTVPLPEHVRLRFGMDGR